jgi:RNA-splicing ligase RtcB
MQNYLFDMKIMNEFAKRNHEKIINTILVGLRGRNLGVIHSTHNFIDVENMILRKGATSAQLGEDLLIPLNMRDGLLVCKGKGNKDWNYSAPHGAGRLYGRSMARKVFTMEEYSKSMEGIYSTSISRGTLDEAPFVYKNMEEIIKAIEPTAEIVKRLIPIYNFKANN